MPEHHDHHHVTNLKWSDESTGVKTRYIQKQARCPDVGRYNNYSCGRVHSVCSVSLLSRKKVFPQKLEMGTEKVNPREFEIAQLRVSLWAAVRRSQSKNWTFHGVFMILMPILLPYLC